MTLCYRNSLLSQGLLGGNTFSFLPCDYHRPQHLPRTRTHDGTPETPRCVLFCFLSSLHPILSSFPPRLYASPSSAFRLVGSALLLRNTSLLPRVVGPNGSPTIPVPCCVCFSSYCALLHLLWTLSSDWLLLSQACPYSIMDSAVEF